MLYQSAHVTGTERRAGTSRENAVKQSQYRARIDHRGHRYIVVEENTENVVAVCWPDGGVDYLQKPYPTISQGS